MSQLNMNNRQSGRRRGRNNNNSNNNSRPQSGGRGGVDQANRIDSRARGNGAQMIEKYRNLARDAQLAGDRVQTEYYLQFADHYFRVVSDFRLRQEEKNAANGQDRGQDRQREIRGVEDFDGHDDSDLDMDADRDDNGDDNRGERNDRNDRADRNDRPERSQREGRGNRDTRSDRDDDNRGNRQPQERPRRDRDEGRSDVRSSDSDDAETNVVETVAEEAPAPRANRRSPRRPRAAEVDGNDDGGNAGIDTAVLPPAIGRPERSIEADAETDGGEEAPAAKPRRARRTLATRSPGVEAAE
ncbi:MULTISPECIES: DUF4167 domain-containing protein [unclassified Sphingopyxis]|uniref:DUF4167 domain-containing protein n=1 Tax=unclassified Sphingopyxis TaxID=2614943 RepID=UPI0028561CC4|nr:MULTISPECIES: DUF4167 domain-containing protein [unclassified Sphingopyxis]MDR6833825.1 hypothetical protein [Sphingopyxis sp. BE122]MDR7226094.1 hypothetical protein [Sphingopyxis sp. BE259]